ncbi:hypothetical protein F5Y12DRAFT_363248 [Xylaria sp. FL1777]|nr:hypothetical protein F5Y12DRAFT_363248 [Xylaria sp. FL1777]
MSTGRGRNDVWTGEAHKALAVALARMHGSIKPEQQVALVKDMNDSGFNTTWEGIRQRVHGPKLMIPYLPSNLLPRHVGPPIASSSISLSHHPYYIHFNLFNLLSTITPALHDSHSCRNTSSQPPPIAMSSPTKSTKKWDDRMNAHLFLSICDALELSFSKENKDAIVAMMRQRFGHDVNWNGIR